MEVVAHSIHQDNNSYVDPIAHQISHRQLLLGPIETLKRRINALGTDCKDGNEGTLLHELAAVYRVRICFPINGVRVHVRVMSMYVCCVYLLMIVCRLLVKQRQWKCVNCYCRPVPM